MAYRIELSFVGDAPESELERARILANQEVTEAIAALSRVLEAAGFEHVINARTVRATRPRRKLAPHLAAAE